MLLAAAYFIVTLKITVQSKFLPTLFGSLIATFAIYEVLRRIPLPHAVLGIQESRPTPAGIQA